MTDREKIIYDILCSDEQPPEGQHWEGFVTNKIVAALAQPEQEEDYDAIANKQLASLKAAAKVTFEDAVVRAVHKLYNAPPQREWQGLTDEELHALHYELKVQMQGAIGTVGMYRILEKALREKNNGGN